jgi:hypothetical protein
LRSREMVTCCLSSSRYFSLPLMLPRNFFHIHREFKAGDTLSSRHVSSHHVLLFTRIFKSFPISSHALAFIC